jgi:hypothetical protein
MLGYVYNYSYAQQGQSNLPEVSNHSLYFQDDWRIRPNLTLNLGVRYSNETPAHSKFPGGLSVGSLDVKDNYYTSGSIPGVLNCPAGGCVGGWIHPQGFLWNRDNNNFRPRVGLAWSVNDKTVVRAGFAMMTLDWNLGWTTQNEIGGASFYNQSVTNAAQRLHAAIQHQFGRTEVSVGSAIARWLHPHFGGNASGPAHNYRSSGRLSQPLHAELECQHSARRQEELHG